MGLMHNKALWLTLMSGGSAPSYSAEATTLFAAMSSQPDNTRKAAIDALTVALIAAGVWSKLDILYITAAHDAQAARLNWKTPASFALGENGGLTFTVDAGYAGNGSTGYLTTGFTPNANAVSLTVNSGVAGVWIRNNVDAVVFDIGNGSNTIRINTRSGSQTSSRLNVETSDVVTLPLNTSVGHTSFNRSGASATQTYKNGSSIGTGTSTASAIANAEVWLLRDAAVYSTRQIAAAYVGGSLTAGEHSSLHTALNTYMVAVGAA